MYPPPNERIVWLYAASVAEVAAWNRVSSPRVSTSHTEIDVLWLCAREVRTQNGCSRPRNRRTEHTFAGRELLGEPLTMGVPSVFAASGSSERVQVLSWGTACYVRLMRRARCPQRYCATILRDQQGEHGLLAQAPTSEPAISRGALPALARVLCRAGNMEVKHTPPLQRVNPMTALAAVARLVHHAIILDMGSVPIFRTEPAQDH